MVHCDIEKRCSQNSICNINTQSCMRNDSYIIPLPKGIIKTNLLGNDLIGDYSRIMNLIASYFGTIKEIVCNTGMDLIEYEEFNNIAFKHLINKYKHDTIVFIDIQSGKSLCVIKSQLLTYWKTKKQQRRASYAGFLAQPGENPKEIRERVLLSDQESYFLNFDMWTTKFIGYNEMEEINNSPYNVFLLIPTQYRYFDTNPPTVGAHHNWPQGDPFYVVSALKLHSEHSDMVIDTDSETESDSETEYEMG